MNKKLPRGAIALIIAVVVLAAGLFFCRLGVEPFQDYDEATYVEVVKESTIHNGFPSLHFLGVNYFRKPPLLFWLMGASESVIPQTELAARIPAALAGFLTVLVVMGLVFMATGNGYAAAFGGAVLLATGAFLEPSRDVRFDTLAALFNMLAVLAFFKARTNRTWLIWLGVFIGLGIMSKGPLVIYALAAILAAAATLREWKIFTHPYVWGGIAALLAIVLPWHIYETVGFGAAFWQEYVGVQVLERVAAPLFRVGTDNNGYLSYLAWFAAPWSELFVLILGIYPFVYKRLSVETRAWYLSSVAGVASVLIICLVTQTKAITYLIPLYPFLAVAVTVGGYAFVSHLAMREKQIISVFAMVCLSLGLWYSAYNGFHVNPDFAPELSLAQEEKTVGLYLAAVHAPIFYVYNTMTLGSVMFYSGIVQPPWLGPSSNPTPGSYVLYQTKDKSSLEKAYPSVRFSPVVPGSSLMLAEVLSR